jgi:hypothetical protein
MKAKNKRVLTELTIQKTKAAAGRPVLVWDVICPGLVFCVQPSGFKAFRYFYSINGRARWHHMGLVYLSDARRIGFKLRAKIAEGIDPVAERRANVLQQNITFAGLHERYLTEFAKTQNKSWKRR